MHLQNVMHRESRIQVSVQVYTDNNRYCDTITQVHLPNFAYSTNNTDRKENVHKRRPLKPRWIKHMLLLDLKALVTCNICNLPIHPSLCCAMRDDTNQMMKGHDISHISLSMQPKIGVGAKANPHKTQMHWCTPAMHHFQYATQA